MQQESEATALILLFLQDGQRVVIGVARVDADGQVGAAGGADLGAEHRRLHVARRFVVEVIEPRLADTDDARMRG